MDIEAQKRIIREQKAGFAKLRRFEIEQMRAATIEDRLDAFARIMGFAEALDKPISRKDDDILAEKWKLIRSRHEGKVRRQTD